MLHTINPLIHRGNIGENKSTGFLVQYFPDSDSLVPVDLVFPSISVVAEKALMECFPVDHLMVRGHKIMARYEFETKSGLTPFARYCESHWFTRDGLVSALNINNPPPYADEEDRKKKMERAEGRYYWQFASLPLITVPAGTSEDDIVAAYRAR